MSLQSLETRAVLSHAHSELKRREDLQQLACPPATATFRPIPHYELVTALIDTLRELLVSWLDTRRLGKSRQIPESSRCFGTIPFGNALVTI